MAKNPSPLKVSDLCVTANCDHVINNGRLVFVISVGGWLLDHRGVRCPITIRRVDGQPLPSTSCPKTGVPFWYTSAIAYTFAGKLRRIDPKAEDRRDAKVTKRPRKVKVPVPVGAYAHQYALNKEE